MTGARTDGLRILVADGDRSFAAAAAAALEDVAGVADAEAVTGADAAVERSRGRGGDDAAGVDGVVVGDGFGAPADVVDRLDGGSDLPVVVVTDGADDAVAAAVEAGAVDCFPRTTDPRQYDLVADRIAAERPDDGASEGEGEGDDHGAGGSDPDDGGPAWSAREVFENVSDGLVVHDPDTGEILDVNGRFCRMHGYDREELLGESVDVVTAPGESFAYEAARERIEGAADGDPQLFEWRNRRADGETFPVEVHLAVVGADGDDRVLASVRDVTERKRRQREFEQIFDGVQDGIIVMDPETLAIREANAAYLDLVGYDDTETVQTLGVEGLSATREGFTVEQAHEIHRRVAETGEPELVEWAAETGTGERRWLEVKVAPAVIGGESVNVAIHRDVTERKRRQREYEQIFDSVNDAIAVFDPESGEIVDVNETYHAMMGYDDLETIRDLGIEGLSATDEGYTGERGRRLIREVAESGDPETVEWRGQRRDGERVWLEATLAPAEIGGRRRVLSIQRDVTERKRRERIVRTLHDATDRLQDAETPDAVCEATVEAARTVLDLPMPTCWLLAGDGADGGRAPLEPVAAAPRSRDQPGGPSVFEPGSFEYGVYEGDDLVVYDPSEHRERIGFERAFLVPLGEHGLLGAADPAADRYDEVTLDAARILARHATSALDRVERARELRESERRFRTIAERVDEIIYMANADLTEVEYVNPAYADVYGRPVETLYEDARAFYDGVHPEDEAEFRADVEAMLADVEAGDPDDSYEFAYRVERPDGDVRWVEATGYPILDDAGGADRYVAVAEDVTDRKRRERTLETFHEATRDLTAADSRTAACRGAVRAADEVLGFSLVSAHLYDEDTGRLEPVATTDRLATIDAEAPAFGPGESLAWEVYVEGEATTDTGAAGSVYGPGVSGPDVVLPLGSHGVMLVGAPTGSFDAADVELAQILAATLEASLNHVADERALADREEQLRRQQERARRLERLNEIIRDIERVTVERSARAGIEAAVCERLVAVDAHDLVWFAEPGVGGDELRPRTVEGDADAYLDAVSLSGGGGAGRHPAVAAYREGDPRAVGHVATDAAAGEWRTTALRYGVQSAVAVPVRHEGTLHGILAVESTDPDAFDEATREVLAELGRSIGYAISVAERERALESEGTAELEFAVDDEGLFVVRAAAEADCRVRLERTVRRAGGSFSTFYAVEGADPAALADLANAAASVEGAQVITAPEDDEDGGLLEVRAPTWFGSVFTDHGAVVREATADAEGATLVVEAPRGANVRALVEGFQERFPGAELVAQRQRERTARSVFELQDALREGLTDRQWEALETAYSAGYFAWPRETSGEEVAELLGVTQPTFNKHLRTAERTAFRVLLDRELPGATD